MRIRLTEKHLDDAITAVEKDSLLVAKACLIGQACQEAFGDIFKGCSSYGARFGTSKDTEDSYIVFNPFVSKLVDMFDQKQYQQIRKMLPKNITLPSLPVDK